MDPSFPDDPEDEVYPLPDGVTESQVNDLIRGVMEATDLLGLYADPMVHLENLNGRLILNVQFRIGKVAFTKRVQDPEQDETDTAFHQIETEEVKDRVRDITARFRRGPTPPQS